MTCSVVAYAINRPVQYAGTAIAHEVVADKRNHNTSVIIMEEGNPIKFRSKDNNNIRGIVIVHG